jgi:hypothetical protein
MENNNDLLYKHHKKCVVCQDNSNIDNPFLPAIHAVERYNLIIDYQPINGIIKIAK